jgi:hypothetical protein
VAQQAGPNWLKNAAIQLMNVNRSPATRYHKALLAGTAVKTIDFA